MEVQAISKSVRISPRKMRLVADVVRNMSIKQALDALDSMDKRAALPLTKTLNSAIANAVNNAKLTRESLVIGSIQISDGQALKRFRPSTRGRIHPYKKRGSNIHVVLKSVAASNAVDKKNKKEATSNVADTKGEKTTTMKSEAKIEKNPEVKKDEKKQSVFSKALSLRKKGGKTSK